MYNSDDCRKENKAKLYKSEFVKTSIINYMQKRNYSTSLKPNHITTTQLQIYSSVEQEISNPNSIRYRCYNCDPVIIDNNFVKFLNWCNELNKDQPFNEIEQLVGPFFCHLYLDILQAGHPEKAAAFFLTHISSVEKLHNSSYIQNLINCLSTENGAEYLKQDFRSNRYVVQVSDNIKKKLMNFVLQNCHVIFLQVLQTWFEIKVVTSQEAEVESDLVPNECCVNSKFQHILSASADLENLPNKLIYSVDVSNLILEINCGILSRYHGLVIYNQENLIHIHPLQKLNNLSSTNDIGMIKLNGHCTKVYCITISKNYLVSGSSDGRIVIYELDKFTTVCECLGHNRTVYALKISTNELYLASGSEDHTIRLWNLCDGHFLRIFIGHEQPIICLDFHPNCLYLMSGSSDNNIRLWNIENTNCLRLLHGCQGAVRVLKCHPQGKYLVSASDDKYIRVWDILSGIIQFETKQKDVFTNNLLWSKDGKLLCGTFSDKTIKIWNFQNFEVNSNIQPEVIEVLNIEATIICLEYCFGTFGILTTKCITPI